jgi:tryptophan-rich sensory protein
MNEYLTATLFIAGPIVGGILSSFAGMRGNIKSTYRKLKQPPLSPPSWVFGPVWTLLYGSMGYASYRIYALGPSPAVTTALTLYGIQLGLNFIWTPLFFRGYRGTALIDIGALWGTLVATTVSFWGLDAVAGGLLVPYLAWVSFASYLNAGTWWLNRLPSTE